MAFQWDYPAPFTLNLRVQAEDIDSLKHTNNAVYVGWCEKVAWAHSESLGLGLEDHLRLNRAMAISNAEYDYQNASSVADELTIGTWLTRSDGRLQMERCFQLFRQSDQRRILRGRWQLTCINITSGKPSRMPEPFLSTYLPALVEND